MDTALAAHSTHFIRTQPHQPAPYATTNAATLSHLARVGVLLQRKQRVADAEVGQRVGRLHPHRGLEGVDGLAVPAKVV